MLQPGACTCTAANAPGGETNVECVHSESLKHTLQHSPSVLQDWFFGGP